MPPKSPKKSTTAQTTTATTSKTKKTGQVSSGSNTNGEPSVCPICENVIVDAGEATVGEDSIYCEGRCKKWIHRYCAGLPKHEFLALKDDETAYLCL